MLIDGDQRTQATDPRLSFIVQAPAGSGKTEILTQRYLRLLSTVQAPEQIIALTFTRKAANEMRERILHAMYEVAAGQIAASEHQEKTYAYAKAALVRNDRYQWDILKQPSRLRVTTIDALCQTLTHAIPLQEKQIHYAQISDKPRIHYQNAAKTCLQFALNHTDYQHAIRTLLEHLDNQQEQLLSLFTQLLAQREQWLSVIYQARMQNRAEYEAALRSIEEHELDRFRQTLSPEDAETLRDLTQKMACIESKPDSLRHALCHWYEFDNLNAEIATGLCALLLTSQNTLRKAFDHHVGLKRGACSNEEYDFLKTNSKLLLAKLAEQVDFMEALLRIKQLPEPHYDDDQWNVLQALFTLLPMLAAQLNLIFHQQNEVDFSAISQQALLSLGQDDNPTDLALYLDHHIQHILIDEFQDTSIQQFQLLQQLVCGWEPNDGKTLFIVGDPMQSIYRFRAAEVGLFLRAKYQGVGNIKLIPLELICNFRSTAMIVDWVNTQFQYVFPIIDDMESGAISFHRSEAVKLADGDSIIQSLQCQSRDHEANTIIDLIKQELATYPNDRIAILVRSRRQLEHIIQRLRANDMPFQGVDIDLLVNLPHIQDVWSLTQALLMPANRLAWLALLRSPWCGLSLTDLHAIANFSKSQSIYFALSHLEHMTLLSDEGRLRAAFIYTVLHNALLIRHQQPLVDWITNTLSYMHPKAILTPNEEEDLEQYWRLLQHFEQDGILSDIELFKTELNALYSQKTTPSRLQIMTIHKSKGLEFDSVILPALGGKSPNPDKPLMRWLTLPRSEGEQLLISPMRAAERDECLLYDYMGKLDAEKSAYEQQRLLYVAVTRAKKRLYLFDFQEKITSGSFRDLLSRQIFQTIDEIKKEDLPLTDNEEASYPKLYHLPIEYYQKPPNTNTLNSRNNSSLIINTDNTPRYLGIATHELLQWICTHHPKTINDVPWALANHRFKLNGLDDADQRAAMTILTAQLTQMFQDKRGLWLLQAHDKERNEYELLTEVEGEIATRIIDRTFCENGIRWIIDFKTGVVPKESPSNHQKQLNEYANLLHQTTHESIHCGLYYLANGTWISWVPTSERALGNFRGHLETGLGKER